MDEIIQKDLIDILSQTIEAFRNKDVEALSNISNTATNNAGLYQDHDTVSAAVMVYALSKILARNEINQAVWWTTFCDKTIKDLEEAKVRLENQDYDAYKEAIKLILFHINNTDKKVKRYIERVIQEAKIKKGSQLFDQGLSLERTADILGLTLWEMSTFVGKTKVIEDEITEKMQVKMELARGLFR